MHSKAGVLDRFVQGFVLPGMNRIKIYRCADCQVPQKAAGATKATSEAPSSMFRDWQRTQTQSSATALTDPEAANGCPVLRDAGTFAERHTCAIEALEPYTCALSRARLGILCFSLDIRLTFNLITEGGGLLMSIPKVQRLLLPVLKAVADGNEHEVDEIRERVAEKFRLTIDERTETHSKSQLNVYVNRVA